MRQCTYARFANQTPNYPEMLTKNSNKWQKRVIEVAISGNCSISEQKLEVRSHLEKTATCQVGMPEGNARS
jgi:hypothetical protein